MLALDTSGFLLAGQPVQASSPRVFPLEGQKDVFQALATAPVKLEAGPLCPTLGSQLFPALDALRQTVKALGDQPTPWEVDNSNLRRLVRATMSVVEAHRDSFSSKDYRRGMRELSRLASAVGRYKDAGILEDTVRSQFPGGALPARLEKAIEKEKARRAEQFEGAWSHFRQDGLKRVRRSLSKPFGQEATPSMLMREDERRNRQHVSKLLDKLDQVGLQHEDPDAFHEGRKALRRVVHALLAGRETVKVAQADLDRMAGVVDGLGVAQDSHIAYTWLERKGFDREAAVARATYRELHQAELSGVADLLDSGALERVREATLEPVQGERFAPRRQAELPEFTRQLLL